MVRLSNFPPTANHHFDIAMAPIRLGFIGLSARGWAFTDLAPPLFDPLLADKYTLTAVCTSSAASANESAAKYTALAKRPVKGYHGDTGYADIANDPEVDMVALAKSLGIEAVRITEPDELTDSLKESLAGDRPRLIDVPISRTVPDRLNYG